MSDQEYLHAVLRAPVYEVAEKTPLEPMPNVSKRLDNTVLVKREDRQPVHSFKIRGAYNRMRNLTEGERHAGVVTASAGNHAQGVALAAAKLGIRARIFMPHGVALPKLQATRDHGAEVVLHGSTVDESLAEAQRWATETGAVFIPPFDDPAVIAGQGTVGLEILDVLPDVDTVIMGIGGGGLIAGTAVALKEAARRRGRTVRVIGVQAATAAAFPGSLEEGRVQVLESVSTIADGIAVGKPGALPLRIAAELVDAVVTVTDDEIAAALVHLLERSKLVVEPAGADTFASFTVGGRDVVARLRANSQPRVGAQFPFRLNMDKAVVFDPRTEARIGD